MTDELGIRAMETNNAFVTISTLFYCDRKAKTLREISAIEHNPNREEGTFIGVVIKGQHAESTLLYELLQRAVKLHATEYVAK